MKEIILLGAGGHAAVILDILKAQITCGEQIQIKGLLDDSDKETCMGYPVLGPISKVNQYMDEKTYFIIAIGANQVRQQLAALLPDDKFYTAIHPSAVLGSGVSVGSGSVVMPNAIINANSRIGRHVIVNTGAIVEHDNVIDDYVHLSPRATLCGGVTVGQMTHVGAGATVIQGKMIGKNSIIGAGATVITDIPDEVVTVGTPAKVIKAREGGER